MRNAVFTIPLWAQSMFNEAKRVADPIQAGDKPYDFSTKELMKAYKKAVGVYAYAQMQLRGVEDVAMHRASALLPACKYATSIGMELLNNPDLKSKQRKKLQAQQDVMLKKALDLRLRLLDSAARFGHH